MCKPDNLGPETILHQKYLVAFSTNEVHSIVINHLIISLICLWNKIFVFLLNDQSILFQQKKVWSSSTSAKFTSSAVYQNNTSTHLPHKEPALGFTVKSLSSGWGEADRPNRGHQHEDLFSGLTLKAVEQYGYSTINKSRFVLDCPPFSRVWPLDLGGVVNSNREIGNHTAKQNPSSGQYSLRQTTPGFAPTHGN